MHPLGCYFLERRRSKQTALLAEGFEKRSDAEGDRAGVEKIFFRKLFVTESLRLRLSTAKAEINSLGEKRYRIASQEIVDISGKYHTI